MAIIPHVTQETMEPRRISIPFTETFTSGTLTNKTRYTLLSVGAGVEVIDVRAKLSAFTSTTASTYNFQLVAQPLGAGQDSTWKALSAEVTSKTTWSSTQALSILPDSPAELLFASPRLGASSGYGVAGYVGSTSSTAIMSLPLAKGLDRVNIGFDIGNNGTADTLTIQGFVEILALVPAGKLFQPTNYIGGSGLHISLGSNVNRGSVATTGDGAGFVIVGTANQTAVGSGS